MTLSAPTPPPSSPPPASCLARCGACAFWWGEPGAEIGPCTVYDDPQRADAVGCPSWRRRPVAEPRRLS